VLRVDLVAAGRMGLLDAFRRSPDRPEDFESYARTRVYGAVVDELRAQDWLSRRQRKRFEAEGVSFGVDELFDETDTVTDPQRPVDHWVASDTVRFALDRIRERDARVIRLHYLEGVPQKDIAARLGVTQPRVTQIIRRGLLEMRTVLQAAPSSRYRRARAGSAGSSPLRVPPL
jgi:RNA polymerase sigma factor for flagellar operon FliA